VRERERLADSTRLPAWAKCSEQDRSEIPRVEGDKEDHMSEAELKPEPRHEGSVISAITWGIAVTLVGVVLLLSTSGTLKLGHWWALLILIPAVGSFVEAFLRFQHAGNRFTRQAAAGLSGGLFLAAVAVMFLLGLDWGRYWGIFIVLAGLSTILSAVGRRD
jgi:hypothetical protein